MLGGRQPGAPRDGSLASVSGIGTRRCRTLQKPTEKVELEPSTHRQLVRRVSLVHMFVGVRRATPYRVVGEKVRYTCL